MNINFMVNCPLCRRYGGDRHYTRVYRDNGFIHYDICPFCGLVFQWMPPDQESLDYYYNEVYRDPGRPGRNTLDNESVRAYGITKYVKSLRPSYSKVLDIGSSTGALLHILKNHGTDEGWGVEPNTVYRKLSQALTEGVVAEIDDLPAPRRNSFDLVTIIHTLEHVLDPLMLLVDIRKNWIAEDGLLVVEVPPPFQKQITYTLPHIVLFNKRTLGMTLRMAGFEPIDWCNFKADWVKRAEEAYAYKPVLVAAVPAEPRDTIKSPPLWERLQRYRKVENLPVSGESVIQLAPWLKED